MGVPVRPMARAPVPLAPPRWLVVGGSAPLPAGAGAGAGAGGIRVLAIHAAVGWAHAAQVVCVVLRAWVTIGVVYHGRGRVVELWVEHTFEQRAVRMARPAQRGLLQGSARWLGRLVRMGSFQILVLLRENDSRQIYPSKPYRGTHGRLLQTEQAYIRARARAPTHPLPPPPYTCIGTHSTLCAYPTHICTTQWPCHIGPDLSLAGALLCRVPYPA